MFFREAKRVLEYAAANHDAVEAGMFGREFEAVHAVLNVTVNCQKRFRGDFVAKSDNVVNELEMRWNFAHFPFGAQMNGQIDNIVL